MPGKKNENHWVPEIKSLIEHASEIVPVTAAEWNAIAEHPYTFFLNIAEWASPLGGNSTPS